MSDSTELRKAKRYRLSAPAVFMWAPHDGKSESGRGVTRDINTFGVYVQTDAMPPVGARVLMEVVLPRLADTSRGMRLHAEGVVLRCENDDPTKRGFAVSALFYPEATEAVLSQLNFSGQNM